MSPCPAPLVCGDLILTFEKPLVMGILNVTPDSFSDGGLYLDITKAIKHAVELVEEGAQILDIGGESTRPGSDPVDEATELARVVPIFKELKRLQLPVALSIDTTKPEVARIAIEHDATIINDISALKSPEMVTLAATANVAVVLMHLRGEPKTMQNVPTVYDNVVTDVRDFLASRAQMAMTAGINKNKILIDPGIGFGKMLQDNLLLTKHLTSLSEMGYPVIYGPSRKKFLGDITGKPPLDRDEATALVCFHAILSGAHIVRVHNPKAVRDALRLACSLRDA